MKPPPRYVPVKTLPPRTIVGADGVSRVITYDVTGERRSVRVLDVPLKPCLSVPAYCKSRRMR